MEEHKLAVPLSALEVASSEVSENGPLRATLFPGSTLPVHGKQQAIAATDGACSDTLNPDIQAFRAPSSSLPVVSAADSKGEAGVRQRKETTSSAGTRRNSFMQAEGVAASTSPDGSYISSPFFSGSPMDFPETLQPRALNIATDMQCSLSTPLEKFFDVLDSTDIPVATPSPLATVCTHHTTSPAADAFPLNGAGTQEVDELEKARAGGRATRVSVSEGLHGGSAFPLRPTEHSPQKSFKEQQRQSLPTGRRTSSQGEGPRTTIATGSSDAGLPSTKALESALDHAILNGATGGTLPQDKPAFSDDIAASDADRLLVDFQLLLILLFDQVCNVVPGLRRQDGGAFYSMHLQRIAAGPLHPTLASYADVLLPICSAMNFFSDGNSNEQRVQKQEEQDGTLSVALRYLARHGTVPAAPIAEMVAKCPAAVFIQVVSALECMYSLQRILAPGASEPRAKVSEELDPKTIWGDAVADMEKAASALAGECMSSSLPPRGLSDEAPSRPASPPAPVEPSRHPKRPRIGAESSFNRRAKAAATPMAMHESEQDSRGPLSSPPLAELSLAELNRAAVLDLTLPSLSAESGVVTDAGGEVSPAFIPASVNKRRHPNVQAEILNSCCPERLAQRGTRLLGEVLQKLQCEQAMRPATAKTNSPKQAFNTSVEQAEVAMRQHDASNGGALLPEGESDSLSSGSARGRRKLSGTGEQSLGEALAQFAAIHQTAASSSSTPETEEAQADTPTDGQLKKHGYGLRKGAAKKGKKALEEGPTKSRARLTPVKSQNPQQARAKTTAPPSPSEASQQDPSTSSLPPSLTEQLMRLAAGAEGDFPAALSSTMRGVFFNRSLNRWVCTWSRNGKEYQRSWSAGMSGVCQLHIFMCCVRVQISRQFYRSVALSYVAGKYGYETARGLAMHCRLEKLLSGEAHTLQKGMLAVFKPIISSHASAATGEPVAQPTKTDNPAPEEAERRKSDAAKLRSSPRPANRLDSGTREAESDSVGVKTEVAQESIAVPRAHTGSTYSDMLTLMSQAISRKPGAFGLEGEATDAAARTGDPRERDEIKELADPSVGEHFLAAVAAAAAVCDVPGFED